MLPQGSSKSANNILVEEIPVVKIMKSKVTMRIRNPLLLNYLILEGHIKKYLQKITPQSKKKLPIFYVGLLTKKNDLQTFIASEKMRKSGFQVKTSV